MCTGSIHGSCTLPTSPPLILNFVQSLSKCSSTTRVGSWRQLLELVWSGVYSALVNAVRRASLKVRRTNVDHHVWFSHEAFVINLKQNAAYIDITHKEHNQWTTETWVGCMTTSQADPPPRLHLLGANWRLWHLKPSLSNRAVCVWAELQW